MYWIGKIIFGNNLRLKMWISILFCLLVLGRGVRCCKTLSSLDTQLTQFGCMCSFMYKCTSHSPLLFQLGYNQGGQAYFWLGKINHSLQNHQKRWDSDVRKAGVPWGNQEVSRLSGKCCEWPTAEMHSGETLKLLEILQPLDTQ